MNGRKIHYLLYMSAYLGSLDFHMQVLFPVKYRYNINLPDPQGLLPAQQLIVVIQRVMLNFPHLDLGERKDICRVVAEDVGKLLKLDFETNKTWAARCEKMLEMAMSDARGSDFQDFARDILDGKA